MQIARGWLRPRARLVAALVLLLLPFALPAAPAHADFDALCNGYRGCREAGYANAAYSRNNDTMYWRMYAGHNCTNYAAYRMVRAGMPNSRPWTGGGNAENWGHAMAFLTDHTPTVGSIAWFDAYEGYAGSAGHVAYVEEVVSSSEIIVSEDMWGGDFHWRRLTRSGRGWPSGFIHFHDVALKNQVAPTITGTPQVGQTLSADPGRWNATPATVGYQWFADGQLVTGATDQTWVVPPAHLGERITVQVAVTAVGYASTIATSAATDPVAPGLITPVATPTVTGDAELGAVLTASRGTWAPGRTAKTVQWRSDGVAIPGASSWQLQLGRDQVGTRITAVVTATRRGYQAATAATPPTESVVGGEVKMTSPFSVEKTRGGAPHVGDTLTVVPGTVDPADATPTYTWLRDGEAIERPDDEADDSYTLTADDLGHQVSLRVDLARDGYKPLTVETEPTEQVRTVAAVEVRSIGRRGRAVVVVNVTAPGLARVDGPVRIRVARAVVTVDLRRRGHARAVLTGLRARNHRVVVRYLGLEGGLADRASYRGTVEVLPARRR